MTASVTPPRASEPAKTTTAGAPAPQNESDADQLRMKPGTEEPELALELDVPSDGRDPIGEAMIRDLPQRPEWSEPPSQPDPSA